MTLLFDMAIRSALLVVVGLMMTAVFHKQPAELRHAVLAMAIFAAAAILPLTAIVPTWHVPLPVVAGRQVESPAWNAAPREADALDVATSQATITPRSSETESRAIAPKPTVSLSRLAGGVWFIGLAVCAASMLMGFVRVARVARRARRVLDGEWTRVASDLTAAYQMRRPVTLLQTDAPDALATFGVLQHWVLLPIHASAWSPDRIRAALSHELAHVRRQDWIVQMSAEALRCVFWFNPLMWIACARLRSESEFACDDVVLGLGMAPRDYALHLLEIARVCRHPRKSFALSAAPMARSSTLEGRIAVMLNPAVNRNSVPIRARVATAALIACLSMSVAAVRAGETGQRATDSLAPSIPSAPASAMAADNTLPTAKPKTAAVTSNPSPSVRSDAAAPTIQPGDAAQRVVHGEPGTGSGTPEPAGQSAALVGSVYDVSGGVMPGVAVSLSTEGQPAVTAMTNAKGRFTFPAVAAGSYTLEAALPGFRKLHQNIELRSTEDWDRVITLQLGSLSEKIYVSATRVTPQGGVAQVQSAPIRVGGNVRPPRKRVDAKPVYPTAMVEAGREAVVSLEAVIALDGSVSSVRVLSADIHPDFAIAAAEAVRQWTFEPTLLNGKAVEVQMTVSVEFALSK